MEYLIAIVGVCIVGRTCSIDNITDKANKRVLQERIKRHLDKYNRKQMKIKR